MIQFQGESIVWRMTQKNNLFKEFEVALAMGYNSTKERMSLA